LREASTRKLNLKKPVENQFFGSNVFNDKAMKQYLTSDAFKGVKGVQHGTKIDRKLVIILQWV
jgi:glutamine synthetase